jgi:hypothetical protein
MFSNKKNLLGGKTKRVATSKDVTGFSRPTLYLMNMQLSLKSKILPSLANFNSGIELSRLETTTYTKISTKTTTINMDSVNRPVLEKQVINRLPDYKRMLAETVKEVVGNPDPND